VTQCEGHHLINPLTKWLH